MRDATAVRGVLGRGFGDTLREVRGSNARRSRGAVLPGDRAFRAARLRSGAVFTRDQILEALWGSKEAADPNSITVMVRKIREKIEENPSQPQYLLTVWRVGYKFAERR